MRWRNIYLKNFQINWIMKMILIYLKIIRLLGEKNIINETNVNKAIINEFL